MKRRCLFTVSLGGPRYCFRRAPFEAKPSVRYLKLQAWIFPFISEPCGSTAGVVYNRAINKLLKFKKHRASTSLVYDHSFPTRCFFEIKLKDDENSVNLVGRKI